MTLNFWPAALAISCFLIGISAAGAADEARMSYGQPPIESATVRPLAPPEKPEPPAQAEPPPLKGSAAVESDPWVKNYQAGNKALQHRVYDIAERRLLNAEKESSRAGMESPRLTQTRIALGQLYCATGEYAKAERVLGGALGPARKFFGPSSIEVSRALFGLSLVNYMYGKDQRAESMCKEALAIMERTLGRDHHDVGQGLDLYAKIKAREGWADEAEPLFKRALTILEKEPGPQGLDLADVLRDMALFYQAHGKPAESKVPFERTLAIRETAARFDEPATLRGTVTFPWDPGAAGAKEIPDEKYPFKYLNINGLRVATTLVQVGRSSGGRFNAVLVSITNTSPQRIDIGVGPVTLDAVKPRFAHIVELHPDKIDRIYWERAVWDLTWKRPVLARAQWTRANLGLLRGEPPDLPDPYGGNDFGTYGKWGVGPRSIPDIVARERMHARGESILDTSTALATSISALNLDPVTIPGNESRAGIIFFHNLPFQEAIARVRIGNAVFEFPYKWIEPW